MPTSLEDTRLLMLAFVLAAIPLAMAIEMLWDRMPLPRHREHAHLTIPWGVLRHSLFDPLPFGLVVGILTAYLVVALISNSL